MMGMELEQEYVCIERREFNWLLQSLDNLSPDYLGKMFQKIDSFMKNLDVGSIVYTSEYPTKDQKFSVLGIVENIIDRNYGVFNLHQVNGEHNKIDLSFDDNWKWYDTIETVNQKPESEVSTNEKEIVRKKEISSFEKMLLSLYPSNIVLGEDDKSALSSMCLKFFTTASILDSEDFVKIKRTVSRNKTGRLGNQIINQYLNKLGIRIVIISRQMRSNGDRRSYWQLVPIV